MKTWTLDDRPIKIPIVSNKWIYKGNYNFNGILA